MLLQLSASVDFYITNATYQNIRRPNELLCACYGVYPV